MFKNKTIFLFGFLIILLILIVLVQIRRPNTSQVENGQGIISVPQSSINQQDLPFNNNSQTSNSLSKMLSVIPDNDQQMDVTSPVIITFDKPINPEGIQVSITPNTLIDTILDSTGTQLTIKPVEIWGYNTVYSVDVNNNSTNPSLDQNYKIEFKTVQYTGI